MAATGSRSPAATGTIAGWLRGVLSPSSRPINLALQGGGAHGAFTWGVLDTLLADPRITFEGLSGSSAGAMNAVVLANGWMRGGRDGARAALADFWTAVGRQMPTDLMTQGSGDAIRPTVATKWFANWAGYFSPSQLNPLALDPLRDLIESHVDFRGLRAHSPFKLFVGATQAATGKLRVFREGELTSDMLLASACLPKIHHAVEIDGEAYWDGGYSANPAVAPLFYDCVSSDVLLVLLSPLRRDGTLSTVEDIEARITELGFTTHFIGEMRALTQASTYVRSSYLSLGRLERRLQKLRFHMIDSSEVKSLQRNDTKMLAHAPFLEVLRSHGQARAEAWVEEHFEGVGQRSTLDVRQWLE